MQSRALIMLAVALVMGVLAVFLVNSMLKQRVVEQAEMKPVKVSPVVVAASDIAVGDKIDASALKTVEWPDDSIPDGAFASVDAVIGPKPSVALREMHRGEAVLPYKISEHGARGGLTARIPESMRAITIPVNEVKGVAGFVLPGDHVDVLHTTNVGRKDNKPVTRTLLEDALVLGVDQFSKENEDKPKVVNAVTLLVKPEDGQRLTLAQHVGELSLVLRNDADTSVDKPDMVALSALWSTSGPERPATTTTRRTRRASSGHVVEVIRGLSVDKEGVKDEKPVATAAPEAKKAANRS